MGMVKPMINKKDPNETKSFSGSASAYGTVSSVNANSNTEGTVVVKNVPIEFIEKLRIGQNVEIRL